MKVKCSKASNYFFCKDCPHAIPHLEITRANEKYNDLIPCEELACYINKKYVKVKCQKVMPIM